ncbi:MAG: hypothetical protein QXU18_14875 [Thermoplasmatales archaeon]
MPQVSPELVTNYSEFVDLRIQAQKNHFVDLKCRSWLSSTSVLLLAYLNTKYNCKVTSTGQSNAKGYYDLMTQDPMWWIKKISPPMSNDKSSYIPFSELPQKEAEFKTLFTKVNELIKSHMPVGGENAFIYVLSELTDNIYQHSKFKKSFMMCQAYRQKGYVELSFIDDGISIPGNFEEHGIVFDGDWNAISMAVSGQSTKDNYERGTGLKSSLRVYCEGAGAEAMIVSRNGVFYEKSEETLLYQLDDKQQFQGTLISIRIPMKTSNIDIYKYLD